MDLDREFVGAVLRGGRSAFLEVQNRSMDPEVHLFGDGKTAWNCILEHWRKYNEFPSTDVVVASTGCDLTTVSNDSYRFFLDEVINRRLYHIVREGAVEVDKKLESRDPQAAAEIWTEIHRKIQESALTETRVESLLALGKDVLDMYDRVKAGERGIPTPWEKMDEQTMGWWPEDLIVLAGRLGAGKCVHEDTLITDPVTGVPRRIGEVFCDGSHRKVHTWSRERGIHSSQIAAKVDTGRKQCLRVTFASGRSIVVTPEHPFLGPECWVKAEDILVGDTMALASRIPFPECPKEIPREDVDLLAVLLTEGSYTGHHVGFSNTDDEIISIANCCAKAKGIRLKHMGGCDYDFVGTKGKLNPVRGLLRQHGMDCTLAKQKTLPEAIFRLSVGQLSRFLSVFWMCDGYVDKSGPGLGLASEEMIRQIQSILLRFGVQSVVRYKPVLLDGKMFDSWKLTVLSSSWGCFVESIPLWSQKKKQLAELLLRKRNPNLGFPCVSRSFVDLIRQIADCNGSTYKEVGRRLGWASKFSARDLFGKGGSLFLRRFEVFCDVFECRDEFQWMWGSDIYWDRVKSISDVGEQKIYDLSVIPTACFVANDVVVHNTWLLLLLAHAAWQSGSKVLIVGTEMNKVKLAMRFFSLHFKMTYDHVRKGRLSEFTEDTFRKGVTGMLRDQGIYLVGGGKFDFSIEAVEAAVEEAQPDFLLVDGAYLIKNRGKDRHERVSNTFDDLKRMGASKKIAVCANTQLNRDAKAGQKKTITAENVGITDVAGWNADVMYGVHDDDEMRDNSEKDIIAMKVREAKGRDFRIRWDLEKMDFSEIATDDQKDGGLRAPPAGSGDDDFDDLPF